MSTETAKITDIRAQLARDEGCVLVPYRDSKGLWTVGIGHCLGVTDPESIPEEFRGGITQDQCDALFAQDLQEARDCLDANLPWWDSLDGRDGPRSNVLVNMVFNLGVRKLASFYTFLRLMHAQDWNAAAADLRGTLAYKQLPVRYERLARQVETGEWQ